MPAFCGLYRQVAEGADRRPAPQLFSVAQSGRVLMAGMDQPSPRRSAMRHADRRPFLTARAEITRAVRAWFEEQGFAEVETGILQVSPGNETHLHAPRTELHRADGA